MKNDFNNRDRNQGNTNRPIRRNSSYSGGSDYPKKEYNRTVNNEDNKEYFKKKPIEINPENSDDNENIGNTQNPETPERHTRNRILRSTYEKNVGNEERFNRNPENTGGNEEDSENFNNRNYNNRPSYESRNYNSGGGYNNNRGGGYENRNYNAGGGYNNNRGGGYENRNNSGGGYNNNRGGGYENRNNEGGGYNNNRGGGYENRNYNSGGGYNNNRGGGYENRNNEGGGYNNNRGGGYENRNNEGGGYNNNRGGGYENRNNEGGGYNNRGGGGGYNNNRGGGGGYNNNRGGGGGYNNNRGGGGGYNNRGGGSRLVKANQLNKRTPINYGFEEEIIPEVILNEASEMRLNKYIAQCGVCGRRDADDLIKDGKVQVNGITITQMGIKIHPKEDVITFNGQELSRQKKVYILYNKPKNNVSPNTNDERNRKTVLDAIEDSTKERVYPVGRLDKDTTGLIILTNDGDLTEKLTHPSNDISKFYHVILSRPISEEEIERLVSGVELEDGLANADSIQYVEGRGREEVLVEIHIGRNRIVRRMFELMGFKVKMLDRVKIAFLTKKGITRGNWRYLTEREIAYLKMLPSHASSETVLHDNNSVDADDSMDAEA